MDKVSMSHLFSFGWYQTKCFKFKTIGDVINIKIYLWSSSKAVAYRGEKEESREIRKFEYLENEKSILDEIKSIFHNFQKAIIWCKNKN